MNIAKNFRCIGSVNTSTVSDVVQKLSAESWEQPAVDLQRMDLYRDAKMISLAYDFDFRHRGATQHAAMQVFGQVLRPILGVVADFYDESARGRELSDRFGAGYFVRASFLGLQPGGSIAAHAAQHFSELHSHRVHIPIQTTEQATIAVDNEDLHIPAGEVFEINNTRQCSISNGGDATLVHLVLDYVRKGEQCGEPDCDCANAA